MSRFPTQYDPHDAVHCDPGERLKITYKLRILDDGTMTLIEAGVIDVYDEIQSHAASVDIHNILARFANGDESALMARQAMFGDFTSAPKSYADMLQAFADATSYFDTLPTELKGQFDNSAYKFFAQLDSPRFNEIMSSYMRSNDTSSVVESPSASTEAE